MRSTSLAASLPALVLFRCVSAMSAMVRSRKDHVCSGPSVQLPLKSPALRTAVLQTFGQTDEQPFRPQVTLARVRANAPAITRKHPIDQPLSLMQHIELIELFQSPPPGESGYRILASLRLAQTAV